jgi:hypothetical protein
MLQMRYNYHEKSRKDQREVEHTSSRRRATLPRCSGRPAVGMSASSRYGGGGAGMLSPRWVPSSSATANLRLAHSGVTMLYRCSHSMSEHCDVQQLHSPIYFTVCHLRHPLPQQGLIWMTEKHGK